MVVEIIQDLVLVVTEEVEQLLLEHPYVYRDLQLMVDQEELVPLLLLQLVQFNTLEVVEAVQEVVQAVLRRVVLVQVEISPMEMGLQQQQILVVEVVVEQLEAEL